MSKNRTPRESSLYCLLHLLKRHQVPYDLQVIKEGIKNKNRLTTDELDQVIRNKLKGNSCKKGVKAEDFSKLQLPVIIELSNGSHRLVEKVVDDFSIFTCISNFKKFDFKSNTGSLLKPVLTFNFLKDVKPIITIGEVII